MPTVARTSPTSVLTALGFSPAVDRLYQRLLTQSGRELASVARSDHVTLEQLLEQMHPLVEAGIIGVEDDRVHVAEPLDAVSIVLAGQADATARIRQGLDLVAAALPFVAASSAKPRPGEVHDVEPIDGEISSGGEPAQLLTDLILRGKGDLLWWRPDAWRLPREDRMTDLVRELTTSGRRSRAIYPVRAVREAPATLRHRAEAGEEIRVVPELPTRMIIIGSSHMILPEPLGMSDQPRTLTRQRGLVEAGTLLFEMMWERSTAVPDLERGEARPDLRRFLLQQMAAGFQDEQIARTLGVSLRTVRRRIAAIMTEVGADTRFQVGVEAARRGWL